jgi:ABC-type nitrate/sulfonate/bicarbonate transport system permease component
MSGTHAAEIARRLFLIFALPMVLVAIWWFASAGTKSFYFPALSTILDAFGQTWLSGRMHSDVIPSLVRLALGYLAAAGLGVVIGVPVGASRTLRRFLEPPLEFLRAIPPPVLVPILIIFAGIGTPMKVLVIVSGSVWPVLLNTVEGVRGLDEVLDSTTRAYRIGGVARLVHFVLPGASPQIFAGLRQSLSIAIILMVISEMFAASNGLGFAIVQFQRSFAIPQMWTGIILLGVIGLALSLILRLVETKVLGWYFGFRLARRGGA